MNAPGVVIVGASYAGLNAAIAARSIDAECEITLLGDEQELPYQRPPLSKEYLRGGMDVLKLALRPKSYYEASKISLRLGSRVDALNRSGKTVHLASGEEIPYRKLILATGCRARLLSAPGCKSKGVHYLRTIVDALRLANATPGASTVAIIGGGFIGLEIAASLRRMGKNITVIEAQSRLLSRALSPEVGNYIARWHENEGVKVLLGAQVARFRVDAFQRVTAVELADGQNIPADIVIVGIGVHANFELAHSAGIHCDNGVLVNGYCETSDPDIYAAGDCTSHSNLFTPGRVRLECVQNAIDQGRVAGSNAAGSRSEYVSPPWFWSDQYEMKLQGVGISTGYDRIVIRGKMKDNAFSVFYFAGDKLLAVESINKPGEHLLARKLLASHANLSDESAADPDYDLRQALPKK